MTLEKKQVPDASPHAATISEFNYLKITALLLLIFVHSDLLFSYPGIMDPVQWFLLSAFFFISGFLAYESFHKREKSLQRFFKSKARTLYLPFVFAVVFYFIVQTALGVPADPINLAVQISMVNLFDAVNIVYNGGSLWFIPCLLAFMLIICLIEKYVESTKIQVAAVSAVWLATILLWVFDSPLRLGQLFSQFLLIFIFGFYIHKFNLYDKILNYTMALLVVPLVVFFCFDLSSLFSYANTVEALKALLYFNIRSIVLTLGVVLLSLLFLRKIGIPKNGFAKQIASRSAFIYLAEPFVSFMILSYVFGQADTFFDSGILFYLYQATRVVVLLILMPLTFMAWQKIRTPASKKADMQADLGKNFKPESRNLS